jgi:uncharacterized protein DUF4157
VTDRLHTAPQHEPPAPMHVGGRLLQRKCACGGGGGECDECKEHPPIQRRAIGAPGPVTAPPIVHDTLQSPGRPLDGSTGAFMQSAFGHDFGKVRVHTDARAADSARAVNAHAYTVGEDVVFGAGAYAPDTQAGKRLIAHELTHVVQQRGSRTEHASEQELENEAETRALDVTRGGSTRATPLQVQSAPLSVQRDAHKAVAPADRIKNVDLTRLEDMKVIRKEPDDPALKGIAVQITLDSFMAASGEADVEGAADCDKFRFGFFQICRPFDTRRVVWGSASSKVDFGDDRSEGIRKQEPALDVNTKGDIFTVEEEPADLTKACAAKGAAKHHKVLFTDKPSTAFILSPAGMFIRGMAWHDFFFTAFSVILPDATVKHLKSFYWTIHYCETFDPPTGGALLGKSTSVNGKVEVGAVMDGAPKEPGLDLAGSPATKTCNEIIKGAPPKVTSGVSSVVCGAP